MEVNFTESHIAEIAKKIIKEVPSKILCFYGAMGSGKTTIIKALVKELSGNERANSPTFGIVNEYHHANGELLGFHFDFYRIEQESEALDLGLEDYLNRDVWVFIEWPEKITSFIPREATTIKLDVLDGGNRRLRI